MKTKIPTTDLQWIRLARTARKSAFKPYEYYLGCITPWSKLTPETKERYVLNVKFIAKELGVVK